MSDSAPAGSFHQGRRRNFANSFAAWTRRDSQGRPPPGRRWRAVEFVSFVFTASASAATASSGVAKVLPVSAARTSAGRLKARITIRPRQVARRGKNFALTTWRENNFEAFITGKKLRLAVVVFIGDLHGHCRHLDCDRCRDWPRHGCWHHGQRRHCQYHQRRCLDRCSMARAGSPADCWRILVGSGVATFRAGCWATVTGRWWGPGVDRAGAGRGTVDIGTGAGCGPGWQLR